MRILFDKFDMLLLVTVTCHRNGTEHNRFLLAWTSVA